MSSRSDIAISVRHLGKAYTIRHNKPAHTTLAEAIIDRLRHPLRRSTSETFWALKDVSFDVKNGEVVGIIGRNGAGKSTLLKILSRITEPTTGQIDLYGRVGSLLEVGTGFHQELTGRENIFLNGAILGMTRAEIRKQFEAIVEFSGVEQFLDTPVKRYSSGMYVRLAFAVAAHLRSEILVVDEVLAVGDVEFQNRCLHKMRQVATDGRTVVLVSHNMRSIVDLCQSTVFLHSGVLVSAGSTADVVAEYGLHQQKPRTPIEPAVEFDSRRGTGEYRFIEVGTVKPTYGSDEPKLVSFTVRRRFGALSSLFVIVDLRDDQGHTIAHLDSRMRQVTSGDADLISGLCTIRAPWLKPGNYRLTLQLGAGALIDEWVDAAHFEVIGSPYEGSVQPESANRGLVFADFHLSLDPKREDARSPTPAISAR